MQKRDVLNSPRLLKFERRRKKILLKKVLLRLLGLLVIFAGLVFVYRIDVLRIKGVAVKGNAVLESETIKTLAEEELAGNYFGVFPKVNIFFYPKKSLQNRLQTELKRISDLSFSVKRPGEENFDGKYLEINVTEREAKYLWCEELSSPSPEGGESKCFFMDEAGYIFDEAPYFSGEVYFKFYGSPDADFTKFLAFRKITEDMGMKPAGLSLADTGDARIFLSGKNRPEIIFRTDADLQKFAENLQAALGTEPLQSDFKNKYSSLEYIDLRYGNKVYYKFK